ncbi:unnamed protein product [Leptosia nina]|uniref:Uncharacterized protein n=1 Tax=Leptosia nina TaxID=320188 RepID=A0AAV1JY30_9NEOP
MSLRILSISDWAVEFGSPLTTSEGPEGLGREAMVAYDRMAGSLGGSRSSLITIAFLLLARFFILLMSLFIELVFCSRSFVCSSILVDHASSEGGAGDGGTAVGSEGARKGGRGSNCVVNRGVLGELEIAILYKLFIDFSMITLSSVFKFLEFPSASLPLSNQLFASVCVVWLELMRRDDTGLVVGAESSGVSEF